MVLTSPPDQAHANPAGLGMSPSSTRFRELGQFREFEFTGAV